MNLKSVSIVEAIKFITDNIYPHIGNDSLFLKGAIIIEYCLNGFLEKKFVRPELFDTNSISFAQKITLCRMHGLSESLVECISLINKLRNSYAHSLEYDNKVLQKLLTAARHLRPDVDADDNDHMQFMKIIGYLSGRIMVDGEDKDVVKQWGEEITKPIDKQSD